MLVPTAVAAGTPVSGYRLVGGGFSMVDVNSCSKLCIELAARGRCEPGVDILHPAVAGCESWRWMLEASSISVCAAKKRLPS